MANKKNAVRTRVTGSPALLHEDVETWNWQVTWLVPLASGMLKPIHVRYLEHADGWRGFELNVERADVTIWSKQLWRAATEEETKKFDEEFLTNTSELNSSVNVIADVQPETEARESA